MKVTRRQFVKGGVAAFTVTFAAPEFLSDLARAQGAHTRNLVVLYLSGGNDALSPMANMGQTLYEPPDVSGWRQGQEWFSTGAMLSRMNFASQLAANQRFNLAKAAKPNAQSPESLTSFFLNELVTAPMSGSVTSELTAYLRATGAWTGSDTQLQAKAPGLVHLIAGSAEYQLV